MPEIVVSVEEIKAAWLSQRQQLYTSSSEELERRRSFEEAIKRPYFHIKPLDAGQLVNWMRYLDYIEQKDDHPSTIRLYERCLVPCASYPGANPVLALNHKVRLDSGRTCRWIMRGDHYLGSNPDLTYCCGQVYLGIPLAIYGCGRHMSISRSMQSGNWFVSIIQLRRHLIESKAFQALAGG